MPARRDYADAWRDACVTLAQVPVAGLLAADYFSQQWVERVATYLSHVSTRVALARPAGVGASGKADNTLADVLSEDLAEATRTLVRGLVTLPAEAGHYFNRSAERLIREVLTQIQPDAKRDVGTYVISELDKVNRDVLRLREVAEAESVAQAVAGGAAARQRRRRDETALKQFVATVRAIARRRPDEDRGLQQERLLRIIQEVLDAALARLTPETPAIDTPSARERAAMKVLEAATGKLLAFQAAQDQLKKAENDLADEERGAARPRARREAELTPRGAN